MTIFKDKINYLEVNIENIDLALDKVEKMSIMSLETRENIEFLVLVIVFLLFTKWRSTMNNFQNDDLLDMAKEKNQEEVNSQLFLKATQSSSSNGKRWLAALGTWMVAKGEKLQARYTTSLQTNQLGFPLSKVKKARAH